MQSVWKSKFPNEWEAFSLFWVDFYSINLDCTWFSLFKSVGSRAFIGFEPIFWLIPLLMLILHIFRIIIDSNSSGVHFAVVLFVFGYFIFECSRIFSRISTKTVWFEWFSWCFCVFYLKKNYQKKESVLKYSFCWEWKKLVWILMKFSSWKFGVFKVWSEKKTEREREYFICENKRIACFKLLSVLYILRFRFSVVYLNSISIRLKARAKEQLKMFFDVIHHTMSFFYIHITIYI